MTGMDHTRPGTLLLFWDYDTQWGSDRRGRTWGKLEFEQTQRLLELLAHYAVPACFAVVGAAALPGARPYSDPAQIRRIAELDHEVASHSFRHEWLPGLNRTALLETLWASKDALEQCIGGAVVSFVPPYNQPVDYPRGWSFSLSERQSAGPDRIDLPRLCGALDETGYRICRVAYRSLLARAAKKLIGRPLARPGKMERIGRISCFRLNTPGGFDGRSLTVLERCARSGGVTVVYAHPHSLGAGNSEDEACLVPFLERVHTLRAEGRLRVCRPRDMI